MVDKLGVCSALSSEMRKGLYSAQQKVSMRAVQKAAQTDSTTVSKLGLWKG